MITYNMSRHQIESEGRRAAQTISETESTRLVRVLGAFDLFVLKDDISLAPHLTSEGFWEAWITSWLTRWLRPGMTFIDIGANSGYYTHIADLLVGKYGHVVAYEPNPVYAELLKQSRNKNDAGFKIREVALADEPGRATLSVPNNYHGSASIRTEFKEFKDVAQFDVRQTTLNLEVLALTFFRHDIVKIDAEGAEELIWNGGWRLWESAHHTTLMIEYTPDSYSNEFIDKLFEWGHVTAIDYDGGEVRVSKDWILSLSDWRMLVVRKR